MKGFSDTKYRNLRLDVCFNNPFGGKTSFNILEVIPKPHLVIKLQSKRSCHCTNWFCDNISKHM